MKKILLVEDTPHLAEELADILQLEGFEVTIANNGVHGLESLPSAKPDIIITDLLMPKMDGFEFIQKVRGSADFSAVPIIALSAKTAEEDKRRARQNGASAFIQKPCKAHELISSVRTLLR